MALAAAHSPSDENRAPTYREAAELQQVMLHLISSRLVRQQVVVTAAVCEQVKQQQLRSRDSANAQTSGA